MTDVARTEVVEEELNRLIERRATQRREANEIAQMWKQSEEKHRERERRRIGAEWYRYHLELSDSHAQLAREHEAKALRLLEVE